MTKFAILIVAAVLPSRLWGLGAVSSEPNFRAPNMAVVGVLRDITVPLGLIGLDNGNANIALKLETLSHMEGMPQLGEGEGAVERYRAAAEDYLRGEAADARLREELSLRIHEETRDAINGQTERLLSELRTSAREYAEDRSNAENRDALIAKVDDLYTFLQGVVTNTQFADYKKIYEINAEILNILHANSLPHPRMDELEEAQYTLHWYAPDQRAPRLSPPETLSAAARQVERIPYPGPHPDAPQPVPGQPLHPRAARMRPEAERFLDSIDRGTAVDPALIRTVAAALGRGDWSDPILDREDIPHIALAAYRAGDITLEQFSTVLLRWEAFEQFRTPADQRTSIPLMQDERITPWARLLLTQDHNYFMDHDSHHPFPWNGMTADQLARLETLLSALPESERHAWLVDPFPAAKKSDWRRGFDTMIQPFLSSIYNVTTKFEPGYADRRVAVFSLGFWQAWLDARFGPQAVLLQPEFGKTDAPGVMDGLARGGRPLALHFPGVDGILVADGAPLGMYLSSVHDIIHAYVGSHYPPAYRRAVARAYALARWYERELANGARPARVLWLFRIDPGRKYWEKLQEQAIDMLMPTYDSLRSSTRHNSGDRPLRMGKLLREDFGDGSTGASALLLLDMARHPEAWEGVDIRTVVSEMGPEAWLVYTQARLGTLRLLLLLGAWALGLPLLPRLGRYLRASARRLGGN